MEQVSKYKKRTKGVKSAAERRASSRRSARRAVENANARIEMRVSRMGGCASKVKFSATIRIRLDASRVSLMSMGHERPEESAAKYSLAFPE